MSELSEDHIVFIYEDLKAKGMSIQELVDEMVDHICCLIEPEIEKGISFQNAYNNLINNLGKDTFKNIEHQTLLSTNLKFQNMKKTMFSLGVLGTLLIVIGTLLKQGHIVPIAIDR